jgi:hypothetical protein
MKNLLVLLTVFIFLVAACSTGVQAGGDPPQENQTEIERNRKNGRMQILRTIAINYI